MIDFDKLDKSKPILESKGLCKYFGGLKAVESVDMKVMSGDIFGIIGPNGAGKTTFLICVRECIRLPREMCIFWGRT